MKRRLRKKLRRGEYRELGFELCFALPEHWDEETQLQFWDRAIEQIEALGLAIGGAVGPRWDVVVTSLADRASVTAAQREALLAWLAADPDISALQAGPLIDAWYGPVDALEAAS